MKRDIGLAGLAWYIEWKWIFIKRGRKKGNELLDSGVSLSSPEILSLNSKITKRCLAVMKATKKYETTAGIKRFSQYTLDSDNAKHI